MPRDINDGDFTATDLGAADFSDALPSRLEIYSDTLALARLRASVALTKADFVDEALGIASKVLTYLNYIKNDATQLRQTADGLENVIKLVGKVGFLKPLMKPLGAIVDGIGDRAQQVEDKVKGIDKQWNEVKDFKTKVNLAKAEVKAKKVLLNETIDEIDSVAEAVADAAQATALEWLPTYAHAAAEAAYDTVLNADTDKLRATLDAMELAGAEVEAALKKTLGPLKGVVDLFNLLDRLVDSIDFLRSPLKVVGDILKPIQWALDAIDFIFNAVVSPILDPILEALGFNNFIKSILKKLDLPDVNILVKLDIALPDLEAAISLPGNPLDNFKAVIDQYFGEMLNPNGYLGVLLLDGTDDGELVVGDDLPAGTNPNPDNVLNGLAGADVVSGGLGNDSLLGGDGDDIVVGGAGDDTLDGGAGQNAAVLLGKFGDFSFTYDEVTSTLTTTHTTVRAGTTNQGVDEIRNVDHVVFLDRAVAIADFGNVQTSNSTPSSPQLLEGDEGGTPTRDFLFGGSGTDTINGYALDDYIEGRDGFDSLDGGAGNDWIDGGAGRDFIDGGAGNDTAIFNAGDGAQFDFNFVDLLNDPARRPFAVVETVINIENLTGGDAHDYFWGDHGRNRLEGRAGNDKLVGFWGNDTLLGGDGADQLVGGRGNDSMDGGEGFDIFVGGRGRDRYSDDGNGILWYGGDVPSRWTDPYVSRSSIGSGFVGLPDLGFLPEDYASDVPQSVRVNMQTGVVRKYNADGISIGVDRMTGIFEIAGSAGNDTLHGSSAGNETLNGGEGDDVFTSRNQTGGDELAGISYFMGGEGDDHFNLGTGMHAAVGGAGNDTIVIDDDSLFHMNGGADIDFAIFTDSDRQWTIDVDARTATGIDVDQSVEGDEWTIDFSNIEYFYGSDIRATTFIGGLREASNFFGGSQNDTFYSRSAVTGHYRDVGYGNDGADTFYGSLGDDFFRGGDDGDTFIGNYSAHGDAGGNDSYYGDAGNDVFRPTAGARYLISGGDDVDEVDFSLWVGRLWFSTGTDLNQFPDSDVVINGIEIIRGATFSDRINGGSDANQFIGGQGNDSLYGNYGNDVLYGNVGDDLLDGGSLDDLIFGGIGNNRLFGGTGTDTASFAPTMEGDRWDGTADWTPIEIHGTLDADLLRQDARFIHHGTTDTTYSNLVTGFENIVGTANADMIRGDGGDNVLSGGIGDGEDTLIGRGGDDTLSGGGGNDLIIGDNELPENFGLAYVNQDGRTGEFIGLNGLAAMPGGGQMTVEMLIQHETSSRSSSVTTLMSYAVPGSHNEMIIETKSGGNIRLVTNNTVLWDTGISEELILDGGLHRISVTLDTTTAFVEVYIDGALYAATQDPALAAPIVSNGALVFGQEQDSVFGAFDPNQMFRGGYGDIRIFSDIRTQREIAVNWDTFLNDPENVPNLVANWRPNAQTGDIESFVTGTPDLYANFGNGSNVVNGHVSEFGEAGHDLLQGEDGNDTLDGGGGNDTLDGGTGADSLIGGAGRDMVSYESSAKGMFVDMGDTTKNSGDGFGDIYVSIENLRGSAHDDTLIGDAADNRIEGLVGDDSLLGQDGSDILIGGIGNDTLNGGTVNDDADPATAQVFRYFNATLDRAPAATGVSTVLGQYNEGMTAVDLAQNLVASREFQGKYGQTNSTEFVTLLFENVLDRLPNAAGLANWVQQLDSNTLTRAEVVIGFADSLEFKEKTAGEALSVSLEALRGEWTDEVARLYQSTVDRLPDAGGLDLWAGRLAVGVSSLEDVSEALVNSREFQNKYGSATTTAEFVTLLYENVLERAPGEAGLNAWVAEIDTGRKSRAEAVLGFSESTEFKRNSLDDIKNWMRDQGEDDRLVGGAGDNVLFGGENADRFVFRQADGGNQWVGGLEQWDWLEFQGFGYTSAAEVRGHMTQVGRDVVFDEMGVRVVLDETRISDLTDDMFILT
ncbi:MAG: DUF4214 domain-containing protein [Pseudooceanicola sp.]